MRKATPCINLALGIGSVLSVAPTASNIKLFEIDNFKTPNTIQNISQYWKSVGTYLEHSLDKVEDVYGQKG